MKSGAPATHPHPRSTCSTFPAHLNAGKLDAATACFAKDACLLTQDVTAIHDREHIRPLLAQLIARRTKISVTLRNLLVAGDVALVRERWEMALDGVEGSRFTQHCAATLVLNRIEGQWKLVLLAPWGWGSEEALRSASR